MSRRGRTPSPFSLFSFQDIVTSVTAIIILMTLILALELIHRKMVTAAPQLRSTVAIRQAIAEAEQTVAELRADIADAASELTIIATATPAAVVRELRDLASQQESLAAELEELRRQRETARTAEQDALAQAFNRQAEQSQLDELNARLQSLRESLAVHEQANQHAQVEIEAMKQKKGAKAKGRRIYNPAPGVAKLAWLVEVGGEKVAVAPLGKASKPVVFAGRNAAACVAGFSAWSNSRSARDDYFVLLVRPDGIECFDALREAIDKRGFDMGFDLIAADEVILDPQLGAGEP